MADRRFLEWPFFDARHRDVHLCFESFVSDELGFFESAGETPAEVDALVRRTVAALGRCGLLSHVVSSSVRATPDVRVICLAREVFARCNGLADFAFAMQGLGSGPISLYGDEAQRGRYLGGVAHGELIAAFALSEAGAGSDVAAMETRATMRDGKWLINGEKAWISNAGIADFYVVFARSDEGSGHRGISAFIVDADNPGLHVVDRPEVVAPHPIGTVRFDNCVVGPDRLVGERGKGFAIAMATLDVFRTSVGAAALGFARCALDATVTHASQRRLFGGTLADLQMTRSQIAEMDLDVDAAALLVYRSAWLKDVARTRVSREASMAKLFATEAAQRVIDACVQLHGGRGVVRGSIPERLYREVRALRIYEGASEVQKMIIASHLLQSGN
jgi:acyl-CoA dehydrogenase